MWVSPLHYQSSWMIYSHAWPFRLWTWPCGKTSTHTHTQNVNRCIVGLCLSVVPLMKGDVDLHSDVCICLSLSSLCVSQVTSVLSDWTALTIILWLNKTVKNMKTSDQAAYQYQTQLLAWSSSTIKFSGYWLNWSRNGISRSQNSSRMNQPHN